MLAAGGERKEEMLPGMVRWLVIWGLKSLLERPFLIGDGYKAGPGRRCQSRGLGGHHRGILGKAVLVLQGSGVVLRILGCDALLPACSVWGEPRHSSFLLLLCPWYLLNFLLPAFCSDSWLL